MTPLTNRSSAASDTGAVRALASFAAAAALLLLGCSARTPEPAPPAHLLLRAADLPGQGWQPLPAPEGELQALPVPPPTWCGSPALHALPVATIGFARDVHGPVAIHTVYAFASVEERDAALDRARALAASCDRWSEAAPDGTKVTVVVAAVRDRPLLDGGFEVALVASVPERSPWLPWSRTVAVVGHGRYLSVFEFAALADRLPDLLPEAEAALEHLARRIAETPEGR